MARRGVWIGVALLAIAAASSGDARARRPVHNPPFAIRLLSTIAEHRRSLTMAAFTRAMRACTFFDGHNPLRDLAAGKQPTGTYCGLCRGPDALAPEVQVELLLDDRTIYITPDFSDAVIDKFAAALKAQDRRAIAGLFGPAPRVLHIDGNDMSGGHESDGPQAFFAYLDRLKTRYGNITDAFCRKRRFVMPGIYTPLYNCFVTFERLKGESRVWLQPDASEDGIDTITVEDRLPDDAPGGEEPARAAHP